MPATYPRSNNPYLRLSHPHRRRFRRAISSLRDLSKSMGGRLIVQTWAHIRKDEAGWHASGSVQGQDHLTIKNEERFISKKGKVKRKNVGHILPDGSVEDFGSPYPSLEWLKTQGKVPGMDALSYLQHLNRKGHQRLIKDVRRQLRDRFSQNGISPAD